MVQGLPSKGALPVSVLTEYRDLLFKYVPQPIYTDQAYRRALAQLEQLMEPRPSEARSRLLEVLSTLIESYESREHPTPEVSPSQMLAHLIANRKVKSADVARETGIPPATLSSVLANRRGISKINARKLADYFKVSPLVFLGSDQDNLKAKS
jgi:HTH-type transcriptional regulator/antitoxin HigA